MARYRQLYVSKIRTYRVCFIKWCDYHMAFHRFIDLNMKYREWGFKGIKEYLGM